MLEFDPSPELFSQLEYATVHVDPHGTATVVYKYSGQDEEADWVMDHVYRDEISDEDLVRYTADTIALDGAEDAHKIVIAR